MSYLYGVINPSSQDLLHKASTRLATLQAATASSSPFILNSNTGFIAVGGSHAGTSENDLAHVAFLGQLDYKAELRQRLGLNTASLTDSELLLRAYATWGNKYTAYLYGEYMCLIWNKVSQQLSISISPFAKNGLLYSQRNNSLVFATDFVMLESLLDQPLTLNTSRALESLFACGKDTHDTFYSTIKTLPVSHTLTVGCDGLSNIHKHWSLADLPQLDLNFKTPDEYYEFFRDTFKEAVDSKLQSANGTIGALLSGGLDSSSAVAMACQLRPEKQLHCFGMYSEPGTPFDNLRNWNMDDRQTMHDMVNMYSNIILHELSHQSLSMNFQELADLFSKNLPVVFNNLFNGGWIYNLYKKAHESGIQFLLTGSYGNMAFSFKAKSPPTAKEQVKNIIRKILYPVFEQRQIKTFVENYSILDPKDSPPYSKFSSSFNCSLDQTIECLQEASFSSVQPFQQFIQHSFDIQELDPTCDLKVIQAVRALPKHLMTNNTGDRLQVRIGFKEDLPDSVLWPKNRGLQGTYWPILLHNELSALDPDLDWLLDQLGKSDYSLTKKKDRFKSIMRQFYIQSKLNHEEADQLLSLASPLANTYILSKILRNKLS